MITVMPRSKTPVEIEKKTSFNSNHDFIAFAVTFEEQLNP